MVKTLYIQYDMLLCKLFITTHIFPTTYPLVVWSVIIVESWAIVKNRKCMDPLCNPHIYFYIYVCVCCGLKFTCYWPKGK